MTVQRETPAACRELEALESIFEQCRTAWLKGSEALAAIKEKKLYKEAGFKSWDGYTRKRWGFGADAADKKIALCEIVNAMVPKNFGNGAEFVESHVAALAGFQPEMRQLIFETANQTAPGGKLTAAWIEQTGRRLIDARLEKEKQEEEEARRLRAQQEEEEDADDAEEEEEEPDAPSSEQEAETPLPPPKKNSNTAASSGSSSGGAIHGASEHPITREEEMKKWIEQAKRWVRKGERLALSLDCTPQDLLERYGS